MKVKIFVLSIILLISQQTGNAFGAEAKKNDPGKKVYEERCQICHGAKGDGKGLVGVMKRSEKTGRMINVEARDFTLAVFRFRSTSTGCLPVNEDFISLINKGIPRSFMPSHKDQLSMEEKKALAEYIKTFSTRWKEEEPCKSIPVKKPRWVGSRSSVEKGKKIYKEMKCWECHGDDGKGKGPKSDTIKDDWGKPIVPFDFTTGATKMGDAPENVYTAYTTGLDGTGMPSYEDSLKEDERWHLVSYTLKLMGKVK
ncbi:MAG: c-type cytochrome [Nitrospirae bacterium]|nr:c-type cytochrome [Nitrospirota bacterium]MCL5977248.1 c-type cytochrome [Nitrospirota bacterium]